jgi:hypothetical protein
MEHSLDESLRRARRAVPPPRHPLAPPAPQLPLIVIIVIAIAFGHWQPAAVLALITLVCPAPQRRSRTGV